MSFETIRIYRDIPVINGFLAMPPNHPGDNTSREVSDLPADSELLHLSGSGPQTGSKFGGQQFVRLTGVRPDESYVVDPLV